MSTPSRSRQHSVNPKRLAGTEVGHRRDWAGMTPQQVLARLPPGDTDPLEVLETLIALFNTRHTARERTVSHKTRAERAGFLRRFFRDLKRRAGFHTVPDPRNLAQKHLHAMVQVWRRERLAPATIQTYLSFLRGLAAWLAKPGLVRPPGYYGLKLEGYERHEYADRDRSWSTRGVDIETVLAQVAEFDARVAASLRLMHTLAMRRKESVMFRPFEHVVPFAQTGLPRAEAEDYVRIKGKGGRVRWVPLERNEQRAVVELARSLVTSRDAHMGNPEHSLKRNLRRLDYVLEKFGITKRQAGVTAHGLRHGFANDLYEQIAGVPSPVRGGGQADADLDRKARLAVASRAGHSRIRSAAAYLGPSCVMRGEEGTGPRKAGSDGRGPA